MKNDTVCWMWLSSLTGIGLKKKNQLLTIYKSAVSIWDLKKAELKDLKLLDDSDIGVLLDRNYRTDAEKQLKTIEKNDIFIVARNDKSYPELLSEIHDPPVALFIKGHLNLNEICVAVVGSRRASQYGKRASEMITSGLANQGITVVSGMARGIDSFAHIAALDAGGRTIAVLGCGLDYIYPPENKYLMERIIKNGAVVSEYITGVAPMPCFFPARNRIISGMSLGTVVVEAGDRSGSLITADFALEQGRDVFAVPGSISSSNSAGTNKLIKDGAKMVTNVNDILEELNTFKQTNNINDEIAKASRVRSFAGLKLNEDERAVVETLNEPIHIDIIAMSTGMCIQLVSSILFALELRGIVKQLPGKIFKLEGI